MGRIFVILKIKLTPGVHLSLPWGYMYMTIIVKQVYWYIFQISGERLQDHWSSGKKVLTKITQEEMALSQYDLKCMTATLRLK